MNVEKFNEKYDGRFRYVEICPYVRDHNKHHVRRFNLEQWCPNANKWFRMLLPGTWHQNFESENETPVSDDECVIRERVLNQIEFVSGGVGIAIIVCEEKHCTQYFDASTTEAIGRAALHLLRERNDQSYYYDPGDPPEEPKTKPDFIEDEELRTACEKQWQEHERELKYHQEQAREYQLVQKTLEDCNYARATALLLNRHGYEYEGFALETLNVPVLGQES